ncbi:DUF2946 family protein [Sideroxydans sp. CL21]|uniref:DUF2946 family protein n=1 Tax=Sideroxydans sp. CL21 TaxID=2600596 RepID=UPI0024BD0600|nr:DUF2946 family protein [Sideroxydans sp. CL21]
MFRSSGKFIAILLLLWLPIFNGSALAATVSMQMQQGRSHETAAAHMNMMSHADMTGQHQHPCKMHTTTDEHDTSCNSCGVCHLACTGYLVVPGMEMIPVQTATTEITPYLVAFDSLVSAPLVPPPLVRA